MNDKKYYFLGSALPLLTLKNKGDVGYAELSELMYWNLIEKDKKIIRAFKTYIDLKNLKKIWLGQPIDPRGNWDEKQLNEALFAKDGLPEFVFEFVEKFASDEDKIKNFHYLLVRFFRREKEKKRSDFTCFYFNMERSIVLITTALRAKKTNRDLQMELAYEDKTDFLVKKLLDQQSLEHLELEERDERQIAEIFENNYKEPKKMHIAFLQYRFQKVAAQAEQKPFSIDQILGYLVRLMLIEDFFSLDEQAGKKILDELLR